MGYDLSKEHFQLLFEDSRAPKVPVILKLFKILDEEKKKKKKRAEILEVIENLAPYMNVPPKYALYLLELFLLNYRKDGDYSGLTKENFVDPRDMKGKTTTNTAANLYTIAQMPFRGQNLEAYWTKDAKGTPLYQVVSYGWYPVYIFRDDKWYEVVGRYSSSTSRQMSNANPVEWDDELNDEVYLLSQEEMKMLKAGATHEELMQHKLEALKKIEPELSKRKKTAKTYKDWYDIDSDEPISADTNVKFKVKSVEREGDKAIVTVDIHDVIPRNFDNKQFQTTQNYLKGEMKGMTKEVAENAVKKKLRGLLKDYMATRFTYTDEDPKIQNIIFKFNHIKK